MKNKLLTLFLLLLAVEVSGQVASSQYPRAFPSGGDLTENITAAELRKRQPNIFLPDSKVANFLDPAVTYINFDDLVIFADNSVEISPNRYAGVSFYGSGANTF